MATKIEMAAEIALLTGNDLMGEAELKSIKADDLEKMLEEVKAKVEGGGETPVDPIEALKAPGGVTRRKMNRGSTRRINRALEAFQKACVEFADEIDRQAYITDDEGNRTNSLPMVKGLRDLPGLISMEIAAITNPSPDLPKVASE